MDAENGFLIAGKVYEVPSLDSLTLDESQLMYDQCELVQEDFVRDTGETDEEHEARVAKMVRRPGFMGSLAQIAYQRGNPTEKPGQVKLVLGKTNRLELFSTLSSAVEEPDEVPLALTSEPNESSRSGSPATGSSEGSSSGTSGTDSANGSDEPAGEAVITGPTRLGTSFTSAPPTLAVSE